MHDRGGWPTDAPIDRTEHELAGWEVLTDALVNALGDAGVMNVDELRRGIESMPPDDYERASYYERWLASLEYNLIHEGLITGDELEARIDLLRRHPDAAPNQDQELEGADEERS